MRKFVVSGLTAALIAASVVIPAASASAGTVSVGGGAWDHGTTTTRVYSYYHHQKKYHTASACVGSLGGEVCTKVTAAPGSWAKASREKSFKNTAYWSVL